MVIFDRDEQKRLIAEYHNSLIGDHTGIKRCISKICEKYYWKGMKYEIKKYILRYFDCQKNKHSRKTKIPMVIFQEPGRKPFYLTAVDIVGPMRTTKEGYKYVLSIKCNFTKYIILVPLENQESLSIARAFAAKMILIYSCPTLLLSDQGTNFHSELMNNLCKLLKDKTH